MQAIVNNILVVAFNKSIASEVDVRIRNPRALKPRTQYQEDICQAVMKRDRHIVVNALAGSGKTSTIEHICSLFPDATKRSMTLHACGMSALRYHLKRNNLGNLEVNDNKIPILIKQAQNYDTLNPDDQSKADAVGYVAKRLIDLSRSHGYSSFLPMPENSQLADLCEKFGIELPEADTGILDTEIYDLVRLVLTHSNNDISVIDYEDMIHLPLVLKGLSFPWNELILIDESQDLNPAQIALIKKMANGRAGCVFTGDRHQCQPAGTMVRKTDGTLVPIETLKVNDEVASFDRHAGIIVGTRNKGMGKKVLRTAKRDYMGPLLTVRAGEKETRCTPNHKWVTRFSERKTDVWVTYMMRKGDWFRIGWCQLFYSTGGLHLAQRARIEGADEAWILGVHKSKSEASLQECRIATEYGISLVQFNQSTESGHYTNEFIEKLFNGFNASEMLERANKCLFEFGRNIEYPFYTKKTQKRQGRTTIFITETCNLIPGLMSIPVDNGNLSPDWTEIEFNDDSYMDSDRVNPEKTSISGVPSHWVRCEVFSLEIEKNETYIADGLVTHNSIYGFRGADVNSIESIVEIFNAVELPLSTCWRCPVAVIEEAQKIVPQIEFAPGAIRGKVESVKTDKMMKMAEPGDFILCRTTAPLVATCMQFIRNGKPATVRGRDIGQGLDTLAAKIGRSRKYRGKSLVEMLLAYRDDQASKLTHPSKETQLQALQDKMDTLLALAEDCDDISAMRAKIKSIFSECEPGNNASFIVCSTAHKAKGLESRRVFIIRPELMPFPFARKDWQVKQEWNLKYVAITRSTDELYFVPTPKNGTALREEQAAIQLNEEPETESEPPIKKSRKRKVSVK